MKVSPSTATTSDRLSAQIALTALARSSNLPQTQVKGNGKKQHDADALHLIHRKRRLSVSDLFSLLGASADFRCQRTQVPAICFYSAERCSSPCSVPVRDVAGMCNRV